MPNRLRYGPAAAILAAAFCMLGPVPAQASHIPGTPAPATSHYSGIANRAVLPGYQCGTRGLPSCVRTITMTGFISCQHWDANPFNEHGTKVTPSETFYQPLSPRGPYGGQEYSYNYNGAGYFTVHYPITLSLNNNMSAHVTIPSRINDVNGTFQASGDNPAFDLNPYGVSEHRLVTVVKNAEPGYRNGPCTLDITLTNTGRAVR